MHEATVLIVDDDPVILTMMVEELAPVYNVLAAESGMQALQIAVTKPHPDLILLDVMMSGMDGYEVLKRLKENSDTSDIPVIFVTAMEDSANEEMGLSMGAVDYLTKPFNPAILLARVRTQLTLKLASDFLHDKNVYLEAEVSRRMESERIIKDVAIKNFSELRQGETERQRLLVENRQLLKQSMSIQEEERRSIARELHDELGQALAGLRMDVDFIRGSIDNPESEEMTALEDMQSILDDATSRLRDITERLRPMTIDYLGIEGALQEMVEKWMSRNRGINCHLTISGNFNGLSDTLNLTMYRIIQESLTNIVRHAGASTVEIQIVRDQGFINMTIKDNGQGMDTSSAVSGLGQIGMRERVQAVNGSFEIKSKLEQGVTVLVSLPL